MEINLFEQNRRKFGGAQKKTESFLFTFHFRDLKILYNVDGNLRGLSKINL